MVIAWKDASISSAVCAAGSCGKPLGRTVWDFGGCEFCSEECAQAAYDRLMAAPHSDFDHGLATGAILAFAIESCAVIFGLFVYSVGWLLSLALLAAVLGIGFLARSSCKETK